MPDCFFVVHIDYIPFLQYNYCVITTKRGTYMKKLSVIFTALLMIVAIFSGCSKKEAYRMVKVEDKDGEVIVDRLKESIDAFEGMNLIADDYVGVKEKSYIVLLVDDDKHISAEENTEFSVNATGTKSNGSVTVELVKGQALFEIDEKLNENSYFSVKTPNTTLSVRGTTFTVFYDDINDVTYLEVKDGIVNIETRENNLSEDVTAGEKREIKSGSIEAVEGIEDTAEEIDDEEIEEIYEKKLIKQTKYNSDGTVKFQYEFEYDQNGKVTKYTIYKPDGTIYKQSEYNANEDIIRTMDYSTDRTLCFLYEYEYDANGNMTKQTAYNDDGTISYISEREYDETGKVIKSVSYNADGTMTSQTVSEYNSDGKMSKSTSYNADGTISSWSEYEYDESKNNTKSTLYQNNNGKTRILLTETYELDAEGNILKVTDYKSDGKISSWVLYEYE